MRDARADTRPEDSNHVGALNNRTNHIDRRHRT
jgi:hypothetical protein